MILKKYILIAVALILFIFGAMTLFMGGSVIFDLFGMRTKEGHFVSFVVFANWICGFLYVIAACGFLKQKKWTSGIL